MLDFLHGLHPTVRSRCTPGELVQGLVPPETLRFHVRDSIRRGHAQFASATATDIMHEDDPIALLREMAAKKDPGRGRSDAARI